MFKINYDALGIAASIACAIHCAILPLVLTSLPVLGINIINNLFFEIGMILLAMIIGIYSLNHGFRNTIIKGIRSTCSLSGMFF